MNTHDHGKKNNRSGGRGWRVLDGGNETDGEGQKVPLHSIEAEEYLLSCCFLDGADAMAKCVEAKLPAGAFYSHANKEIFRTMLAMHARGLPIDLMVLAEEMKKTGTLGPVGGYAYLTQISGRVPTTAQLSYFVDKVRELWGLRELIKFTKGLQEQCENFEGELPEMVNAMRAKLESMYDWASAANRERGATMAQTAIKRAEDAIAGRVDKSRWLRWGIEGFDDALGCFDPNNEEWHVIIAALRSQGKSTLGCQIANANLEDGKKFVIFNCETGGVGWLQRAAAQHAGINLRTLSREPRKERIEAFRARLREMESWMGERLWVFEDVFTIDELEVKVREIDRACGGLNGIVVDYLQLLSLANVPRGMNREQQVATISRRLLLLGKKLNITNIILAQLSRKSTGDGKPRRPQISDIRDSGQAENDAVKVILIHVLPEGRNGGDQDEKTESPDVEIILGKNRNGPTGREDAIFDKAHGRFIMAPQRGDPRPGMVAPTSGYKREGAR